MGLVPPTTSVPSYAYLDVIRSDNFNVTLAIAASGESPASSATKYSSPAPSISATKKSNTVSMTNIPTSSSSTTSTSLASSATTSSLVATTSSAPATISSAPATISSSPAPSIFITENTNTVSDTNVPTPSSTTSTYPAATNSTNNNSKVPIIVAAVTAAGVVVAAIIGAGWWRGCLRRKGHFYQGPFNVATDSIIMIPVQLQKVRYEQICSMSGLPVAAWMRLRSPNAV
ncbi:uncharacterized protein LACBIDRAFT_300192 [Laccaria bicolor S238N-H82]|uniref:Predicted protein n=1 Tax=Laccaria bicolor (strain S238N-H82 / ATCC MYA-4686) TaxID=486041 RepID=B0DG91_LACBS|nr:uncharacterized protein LACBIDRAFT_300192 [Laccaria bicolor S238N-H82]EDR06602.1 predicted protein [Laccaria bicolor S238N-H82]|eukprot:XP_001882974.1 predicted protein [Laccaria bicolor S238N-H82]